MQLNSKSVSMMTKALTGRKEVLHQFVESRRDREQLGYIISTIKTNKRKFLVRLCRLLASG